jgi:hypothetical protein
VPFDFLRRKKPTAAAPAARGGAATSSGAPAAPAEVRGATIRFDGLTEEWRLLGTMHVAGRLSDALNKREAVPISDVTWAPIDGSGPFTPVPGLKSVDPYDLILVFASPASKSPLAESERSAFAVHKVAFDVVMEAPPFRITGTVFLLPGSEPGRLLDRGTEMFIPVVGGVARMGDTIVSDPTVDSILVNRFYLRAIDEIDKRSGEPDEDQARQRLGDTGWPGRS